MDRHVRDWALHLAQQKEPATTLADLHTARPYLKTCLRNMNGVELQTVDGETLAALWAQGAAGIARRDSKRAFDGSPGKKNKPRPKRERVPDEPADGDDREG